MSSPSTVPYRSGSSINEHSTEDELIAYCANPPAERVIGGIPYGHKVVRISKQAVIKFGYGISQTEAVNQSKAYELLDSRVVRVPEVRRYFTDSNNWGYLIMDFVKGTVLETLEDPARIRTVAGILDHLASFHRDVPGPFNHCLSQGLLFFPYEHEADFPDVTALEKWWNLRLLPGQPTAILQGLTLALCHLDVAPRNIIWEDGEVPCLIDWASAGFYPRFFEFCAQRNIEGIDGRFNSLLLDAMTKLEPAESEQMPAILQAWSNMQRYHLLVAEDIFSKVTLMDNLVAKNRVRSPGTIQYDLTVRNILSLVIRCRQCQISG
jgi:hypothetical protein